MSVLVKIGKPLRRVALWAAIVFLAILTLFPVYYLILTSLKTSDLLFAQPPVFFFRPSFGNYRELFVEANYGYCYLNSLIVCISCTAITLMLGSLGAFAFARFRFWLDGLLFLLFLITRSYMPITTTIPLYLVANKLSLLDTRILLILTYIGFQLPLTILIMRNCFAGIHVELYECAELDGCTPLGIYFRIGLPLSAPSFLATAILVFIFSWNEFLFAFVTTSFNAVTAPVAIASFKEAETGVHWGELSTLGFCTALPVIIFMAFFRRFIVKGLLTGAVKA